MGAIVSDQQGAGCTGCGVSVTSITAAGCDGDYSNRVELTASLAPTHRGGELSCWCAGPPPKTTGPSPGGQHQRPHVGSIGVP